MRYKSRLEAQFAAQFKLPYETQHLPYVVTHTYTPDWRVSDRAAIETKGLFTGADRAKHKYIQKQHPDFTVLLVFSHPHKTLSKSSKTTYAEWCDKNGIQWCGSTDSATINQFIRDHA